MSQNLDFSAFNRLKDENSTYLKQHEHNPVHWQPWDRAALDLALLYDKPILLSIGYSACHWCHVMAHECFEDEEVAKLMNENFINIKVDREERPDIDQIYMSALTAMGEQGGWPLTIFLSPQGDAFWGGTYFPKHANGRLPGFMDILTSLSTLWKNDKTRIKGNISALKNHLETALNPDVHKSENDETIFQRYADTIARRIDTNYGGITGQPKFPNFPFMSMLWASWKISGQQQHHDLLILSTEKMLNGGIYDHLAGGLARYSTDQFWLVPHFEKMLYDNAQTIRQCLWAYGSTQNLLFRQRIEEVIAWLNTEMSLPNGGFASGLDADSEGEEGKFYVWDKDEIEAILVNDADDFMKYYNISEQGNWEGKNILHCLDQIEFDYSKDKVLQQQRQRVLKHRNLRPRPVRDDKCLTDWNAYIIRALAEAARVFQNQRWLELAKSTYDYLAPEKDSRLSHIRPVKSIDPKAKSLPALSSDFAAMINAALSLYQADPKQSYIDDAVWLANELNLHHKDHNDDYRLTALDTDDVILYIYGDQDEAIPSATSQIIEALTRLALITENENLLFKTNELASRALGRSKQMNYGQAGILISAVQLLDPVKLVLIIDDTEDELYRCASRKPDPYRTDVILNRKDARALPQWAHLLSASTNSSCAILCRNNVCLPPVYSAVDLEKLL
ncbi:thioredoxin domain-containing protein [Pseudochrobactrum sp. MP213Fo]|uniref:thioredoxin domain-containing protein n=1 Tax=Pseudochrobactrum sp. MP213Fo TaxID=3022250 RepID=UPI003BA3A038